MALGLAEGLAEGRAEGRAEGLEEGHRTVSFSPKKCLSLPDRFLTKPE
jgi:flagellar biosynthesis/type III secretory pathway protein FliH